MQPTVANPTGNYATTAQSPQVQEWIRRQLLEQAMSGQTQGAIANSSQLNQQQPNVPTPASSDAGMLPPPNQPPVQAAVAAAPPPTANGGALPIEQPNRGSNMVPGQGGNGLMDPQTAAAMNLPDDVKAMMNAGPAVTPETIEERRSLWTQFVDNVKNSPNLPMMLTHFGAQMTQPLGVGQTGIGQFTSSVQGSLDYLQARKMQDAELAKTQAGTGHTIAQTGTEVQKPALVQAETAEAVAKTGAIGAGTAETVAKTKTIDAERSALVAKLGAEADELVTKKQLTLEQAREMKAKADAAPAEAASMIELRKAHSYYFTHPEMHARAMESAKNQSIDALAKALVAGGDDALTALYKTDPEKALAKARVEAQAGQVGQYWKDQQETREAGDIYAQLSNQYDTEVKNDKGKMKNVSREQYMLGQLITESLPGTVVAKIHAKMGQNIKTPPAGAKPQSGAGWGIQPIK